MTIYDRVMDYIQTNGLTMYKFEKESGLTRSSLRNWKTSIPSYENIKKAAMYMGVSPEWLMTGDGDAPPPDAEINKMLQLLRDAPNTTKKAAIAAAIAVLKINNE